MPYVPGSSLAPINFCSPMLIVKLKQILSVCEFQCNYHILWFVVPVGMVGVGTWYWTWYLYWYWAWWASVGMAGAGCVTLCVWLVGEPTATVGMAGVSGYAGMCASRALAVPPSHPLISTVQTAFPLYLLYFTF